MVDANGCCMYLDSRVGSSCRQQLFFQEMPDIYKEAASVIKQALNKEKNIRSAVYASRHKVRWYVKRHVARAHGSSFDPRQLKTLNYSGLNNYF